MLIMWGSYLASSEVVHHSAEDGWIEIDGCTHLPNFLVLNSSLGSFVR